MNRENFQEQMKKEQQELLEKEKTVAMVKKLYARFGNKILTYMINYASSENGMIKVFKILNLPMSNLHKEEDQHLAIIEWLNKFGERRFLEMHRMHQINREMAFAIDPVIMDDAKNPLYAPIQSKKRAPEVSPVTPANPPAEPQKPSPPVTRPFIPPKAPSQQVQPSTSREKTWPEVERRSGKERRQNPDRRNEVDLIFKNQRFGGERRHGKDRRKNRKPTN